MTPTPLSGLRPSDWMVLLAGGDHAEVYLEESSGTSIHWEDSRPEEITTGSDRGVGLRYLRRLPDDRSFETRMGSLNTLNPAAAARLGRDLLGRLPERNGSGPAPALRRVPHRVALPPEQIPIDDKVALLRAADRAVRDGFPHIRQVSLTYGERHKTFAVIDSEGTCHCEERRSVLFVVRVTAENAGLLQTGYEVIGGLKGFELFSDFDPIRGARAAAARAVAKLSAPAAKAGEMPVVLASSAGGTFVHEAIGHSLEADHVQEGTSPHYKGKRGRIVAPECITIIDDPTLPFHRGSYVLDDEGVPARPTPLVRRGVLRDYLYDRITAAKDGAPANGHGRRESYHHRPIPRMSNLYIAPGTDDPGRILLETGRGLLVTRMGGGQVDTATGEFVFEVEEGFQIEDGRTLHPVRDANLLGVGPQVLQSIDRLGWDIGWGIGTCGKEGQGVPVSDGQPTLRIPKLLVGGRQE